MQVLFSLFHCKPIWAHFFAIFWPPPAICTSKVVMCPRTPNLISCPATQIKNSTFLVNLINFFNFFPLKAFLGTFFAFIWLPLDLYVPLGVPSNRVPLIWCLTPPTYQKTGLICKIGSFSSILYHYKPIWAHFLAFFGLPWSLGFSKLLEMVSDTYIYHLSWIPAQKVRIIFIFISFFSGKLTAGAIFGHFWPPLRPAIFRILLYQA